MRVCDCSSLFWNEKVCILFLDTQLCDLRFEIVRELKIRHDWIEQFEVSIQIKCQIMVGTVVVSSCDLSTVAKVQLIDT